MSAAEKNEQRSGVKKGGGMAPAQQDRSGEAEASRHGRSGAERLDKGSGASVEEGQAGCTMRAHDLDRMEARWKAATPGPWHVMLGSGTNLCTAIGSFDAEGGTRFVADCLPDYALVGGFVQEKDHRPTMDFLLHAHEDVPALIARVRELEAAVEQAYREGLDDGTVGRVVREAESDEYWNASAAKRHMDAARGAR